MPLAMFILHVCRCETNMGANFLGFPAYFEISTGEGTES